MGVDCFKVTFNNPKRQYYQGDTLEVVIHVVTKEGLKLNAITLSLDGQTKTAWAETSFSLRAHTTNYTGIESYFSKKVTLFEKPPGSAVELPPGEYTYMFTFEIPKGIPPSFRGDHGHIGYFINVEIDQPWKFNRTLQEEFSILSDFDLNHYPALRESGGILLQKNYCGCINAGNVTAVVKIPCRGFVPGQIIPLSIQVENNSNNNITGIYVTMKRRDNYHMTKRVYSTKETKIIKWAQSTGVQIKAKSSFGICVPYKVPNVPICNLMECNIIDVIYLLEFEFTFSGTFAFGMLGELPFYVGDTPIENVEMPEDFPNN